MKDIRIATSKMVDFFKTDIWRIRLKNLPRLKSFFIKNLRIVLITMREFLSDQCHLRASALTYYTLLSVVPVAAMGFGIAKGFGFDKLLEKQLLERFPGQETMVMQIVNFAQSLLEQTKGGLIAGIGIAVLFWSVIKVLGQIEQSFNDIWEVKKPRSLARKSSDYLFVMLIGPFFLIISSSATVFIRTQITLITAKVALLGYFSPFIFFVLKLFPFFLIWVLFTFIYILMPNTKVNFISGMVAGLISGTIFQLVQWAYIYFQVGVTKYNAIYGSFAALPFFLVWLQISWLIVLFGAEISFAHQNVDIYEFKPDLSRISFHFKKLLSLLITHLLIKNFSKGGNPLTNVQISDTLDIPIGSVHQITDELVEDGILSLTVNKKNHLPAYQPARDIDMLTIRYIIDALDRSGIDTIPVARTKEFEVFSETLRVFGKVMEKSPENKRLKDI
jgi:membrane protein